MVSSRLAHILSPRGAKTTLCAATGIPRPRISEYLHGIRPIPPHHLQAICTYLQLPPHEILGVMEEDHA